MAIELAGCILKNEQNKILLLHRNKNDITQWELPGGKVENNETAEAAAIREIEEELGITVELKTKLGTCSFTEKDKQYNYTWFQAGTISGIPGIGEPHTFDDLCYFSFEELTELQLSANMRQFVHQVESGKITW